MPLTHPLTDEQHTAAARSMVLLDGGDYRVLLDSVAGLDPAGIHSMILDWTRVPGVAHTVADLYLLSVDIEDANGAYAGLLREGAQVEPSIFRANMRGALMDCEGDFASVADVLATAIGGAADLYENVIGRDVNWAVLTIRATALRNGPLPDGGYLPADHW